MRRQLRQLVSTITRTTVVGVSLFGFLVAQIGFPVVVPATASQGHEAIRPCGCPVTGDCQTCCCGTAAAPASAGGGCCAAGKHEAAEFPAGCANKGTEEAEDKSSSDDCPLCDEKDQNKSCHEPPVVGMETSWVIGTFAQQCRGIHTCWIVLGAVLPPAARVFYHADFKPEGRFEVAEVHACSHRCSPPTPPPRFLAV